MCGRFVAVSSAPDLAERYLADPDDNVGSRAPSWNVAPTQEVPAVLVDREGDRRVDLLRWGLVPSWAKDEKIGSRLANARAETIADKPAFRSALVRRRCLVPADGFYEWHRHADGKGHSQPYFFRRADGDLCAFAAVWELWRDSEAGLVATVALVTTAASRDVEPVHRRMPVLLEEGDWQEWIDPSQPLEHVLSLLAPSVEGTLRRHPVSRAVNRAVNDGPGLTDPVAVGDEASGSRTSAGGQQDQLSLLG